MRCPDDQTLLALLDGELSGVRLRDVDAHLDTCGECQELVATLASGERASADAALAAGDAVGRFTVLEPLGEGAMGAVYAAYDPELDRRVALKLLHTAGSTDRARARARLVREAQALARLSHPNVVTVFDVGAEGDAVHLAMELVDGANLREWWSAAPRSVAQRLDVLLRAGRGLAAAHEQGLVHRDFKPENVIVDGRGVAKVTDFGLARSAEEDASPADGAPRAGVAGLEALGGAVFELSLTRTGALLGTPAYMAPEQLEGARADARSDQFAFAVTVWEALAGERPFQADRVGALRDAIAAGPPAAPPAMRRALADALRRALSVDPADRFDDVEALLEALTPPAARRPARFVAAGLVGALVAVAGGLAAAAAFAPGEAGDPCANADAPTRELFDDARLAALRGRSEGRAAPLADALERWREAWAAARVDACEDTHVRRAQSPALQDRRAVCLDRGAHAADAIARRFEMADARAAFFAAEAAAALPDPDACRPEALGDVAPPPDAVAAEVRALDARVDEVRAATLGAELERARGAAEALSVEAAELGYAPLLARAELARAEVLRGTARYVEAEEAAYAALFAAEGARDDRAAAEAWLELLRTAGAAGRYVTATNFARHAEAAVRRAGDPARLREALLRVRGVVRTNEGLLAEARADLEAARALAVERLGEDDPELASLETSLGNVARLDERYDAALALHRRALALDTERLGARHPHTGRDHHNIAGVLRRLERRVEARREYDLALDIQERSLGSHPDVALTLNSLGLLAFEACVFDEARQRYDAAFEMLAAHDHGERAMVAHNLALLDLEQGEPEAARARLLTSIALDESRLGPDAKRVASALVALGRANAALEDREPAAEAFRRAARVAGALGDVALVEEAQTRLAALDAAAAPPSRAVRRPRRPSPAIAAVESVPPVAAPPVAEPPAAAPPAPVGRARPAGSGSYGAGQAWE